ncbi:YicC/YloC family endoribonuclease [Pelistega suis]|uniref:YicC family protein n=1 Tax=Pelistega suis TaxID=1631957 RepID=A0A849P4D6_9BURK|nr:YicC/YloC family endoribonuclease [Pelistega suis]NOL51204.1 YicC family protein [Pelistega suis]
MIYSMTAFASQQNEHSLGQLTVELKSVNNRFLDLHFRIPDELRAIEGNLRELISNRINRGKVEIRVSLNKTKTIDDIRLDAELLQALNIQYQQAKNIIADTQAPSLQELINLSHQKQNLKNDESTEQWAQLCLSTADQALDSFIIARAREGKRLADTMLGYVNDIHNILSVVRAKLPSVHEEYREKLARKLRETLETVAPHGFEQIKGEELSARIASESALFSLRIDVAEELDRLDSHQKELANLLKTESQLDHVPKTKNKQSLGKRLDFLFQEMNREINTLGSKSTAIEITQSVIDLKLLVEQLREQAQNIE